MKIGLEIRERGRKKHNFYWRKKKRKLFINILAILLNMYLGVLSLINDHTQRFRIESKNLNLTCEYKLHKK